MKRYCFLEDTTPMDIDHKEYAKEWMGMSGGVAELCVICGLLVVKKYPAPLISPHMLCSCKFCSRCKYVVVDTDLWRIKCNHPLNLIPKQDFYDAYIEHKKPAKKINKNNKCKWFERKI